LLTDETVNYDPIAFYDDAHAIQHCLLTYTDDPLVWGRKRHVEEALRMASLIYIKEILQEFPRSATGSRNLVQKLKTSLSVVKECWQLGSWLLWLFFVGGTASKAGPDRAWFTAHLVRMSMTLELSTWDEVKDILDKLLWIETTHDSMCKSLWDEVMVTRTILNGEQHGRM
jgi:hypothetical protein